MVTKWLSTGYLETKFMSFKSAIAEFASIQAQNLSTGGPEEDSANPLVNDLRQFIEKAWDLEALERVTTAVNALHEQGKLDGVNAEHLTALLVEKSRQIPDKIEDMSLSDFFNSGLVRKVESKVLGETVLWAADNAEVPPDNDLVVYRASELRQLLGRSPEEMRQIHAAKVALDGETVILGPEKEHLLGEPILPADGGF